MEGYPVEAHPDPLKVARKVSGAAKALRDRLQPLKPGSSLEVAVRTIEWLPEMRPCSRMCTRLASFVDALLDE